MDAVSPAQQYGRWRPGAIHIAGGFVLFVIAWTAYGSLDFAGKAIHGDVAEAYAWGREFRLGYNQHPPFWAWIAGAWFQIFPREDWAFNLLAVLNAATGLLGAWRLIGLFAAGEQRMAGFLLLLLTPFYTFLCFKYNANTIFLSLWPWTLFAFLGSMDRKNSAAAIWFGVLLGLSFLSKYYALVLAGTCVAASLPHEDRGAYYRSARPWISLAAFTLCVLPHALWLAASTAPPIAYAEILVGKGGARAIRYAVEFLAAVMLYQVVVMAAIAAATRQTIIPWRRGGRPGVKSDPGANQPIFSWPDPVLATLVASPVVLTILLGLAFQLKISANMTVGAFPLAPLLLLQCVPAADPRRLCRIAGTAALALTLAPLAASPLVARIEFRIDKDPGEREPRKELAATATALWHERMGTPLKLVAGSDPFENSVAFYSTDSPSSFIGFNYVKAPWVTPERIAREGLLIECVRVDAACRAKAAPFLTPQTQRVGVALVHRFRGEQAAPMAFDLFLVPPRLPRTEAH